MDDLYEVLQVHPDAEPEIVEVAYKRLARKYHPDVNASPDAVARMASINSAYAVLADSERRAAYDWWLASQRRPPAVAPTPHPPASAPPPFAPAWQPSEPLLKGLGLGALIAGLAPVSLIYVAVFRYVAAGVIGSNRLWLNLFLLPIGLLAAGLKVAIGHGRPFRALAWGRFGAACATAAAAVNLYVWLAYRVSGRQDPDIWSFWSGLLLALVVVYASFHLVWGGLVRRGAFIPRGSWRGLGSGQNSSRR